MHLTPSLQLSDSIAASSPPWQKSLLIGRPGMILMIFSDFDDFDVFYDFDDLNDFYEF